MIVPIYALEEFFARTVYIVDTKGKIAYKQVIAHIEKEPNYKDILAALKGIVQQLVSKVDSYDPERQQTSGSYREPHRGYQQGYRGTYRKYHVASVLLRMGVWLPYPWLDP
jgi:hypothetical protein